MTNTNGIQMFNFQGHDVRMVLVAGQPYFVGKDVASAIGYKNFRDALSKHVKPKYKGESHIATPYGNQVMTVVSEPGMYQMASQSKLPNAEPFQDWVFEEVLPSIRKTGVYATPQAATDLMNDPRKLSELFAKFADTKDALDQANERLVEAQPKVDYYQNILSTPNLVPVTLISKDYGMTPQKFNTLLNDLHIQYKKCGTVWTLYSEYDSEGYTQTLTYYHPYSGQSSQSTKWTQKGRVFLYNTLKEHGILPTLERQQLENKQTQTA